MRSSPLLQFRKNFERWMGSVSGEFSPKLRMGRALTYTFALFPRLCRYILNGRYNIDNNGVENAIRPLAVGRKNYLFCSNHDAAVRATIVYSLFASCKARGIYIRALLENVLCREGPLRPPPGQLDAPDQVIRHQVAWNNCEFKQIPLNVLHRILTVILPSSGSRVPPDGYSCQSLSPAVSVYFLVFLFRQHL